jgi:hypothetical protein
MLVVLDKEDIVFTHANMKNHSKTAPNRNFVVELEHFGVKRCKNYKNRGFKTLTFLSIRFYTSTGQISEIARRQGTLHQYPSFANAASPKN